MVKETSMAKELTPEEAEQKRIEDEEAERVAAEEAQAKADAKEIAKYEKEQAKPLTGEARIDALVQTLNATLNTNLEGVVVEEEVEE
jgi:hypothetical protein